MAPGFFGRLFGSSDRWDLTTLRAPWGARPAIANAATTTEHDDTKARWAPGAIDGVMGKHGAGGPPEVVASGVVTAVLALTESLTQANLDALYALITSSSTLGYVDAFVRQLRAAPGLNVDRVHDLGLWLATHAADAEAVKCGLAILNVCSAETDQETLLTLGRNEEFTLFAVVALTNALEHPDPVLWELAKHVDGWGRIHVVERLAQTKNPRIQSWLLREGFKNSVMVEYLAHSCATAGRLHLALEPLEIDDALFDGAAQILAALITGAEGPSKGIHHYADAARAVQHFLRHAQQHATTIRHLLDLETIADFLTEHPDWAPELIQEAKALLARPEWKERVATALQSPDRAQFWRASRAAPMVGLDPWEHFATRVVNGEDHWGALFQTRDPQRLQRALTLATKLIPLEQIATGPALQLGLSPEFAAHRHLDAVLQELPRLPHQGWPFIKAGLSSPVIRNRHAAIRALTAWTRTEWPAEALVHVRECTRIEPDPKVKAGLELLRPGEV